MWKGESTLRPRRGEAVLIKFHARRYTAIGLTGIVLLAMSWALLDHSTLTAQQIQRFPAPLGGPPTIPPDAPDALSSKQKNAIVTTNFKKTKQDTAKLRKLVDTLEKEVERSNPNVLSLHIVQSASKIEQLARKIKNEAKDY